jgi:hypothetical protein
LDFLALLSKNVVPFCKWVTFCSSAESGIIYIHIVLELNCSFNVMYYSLSIKQFWAFPCSLRAEVIDGGRGQTTCMTSVKDSTN